MLSFWPILSRQRHKTHKHTSKFITYALGFSGRSSRGEGSGGGRGRKWGRGERWEWVIRGVGVGGSGREGEVGVGDKRGWGGREWVRWERWEKVIREGRGSGGEGRGGRKY